MYSSVSPPNQDSSVAKRDGEKDEKNPPRGISKEMWEVFILIFYFNYYDLWESESLTKQD